MSAADMKLIDLKQLLRDYQRDGVVCIRQFLSAAQVKEVRAEVERHIREELASLPPDAATREADGVTVRNLWRLERYNQKLRAIAESPAVREIVGALVQGEPLLGAIETFNKPARVGSGVPYHQDNAYFCQDPPDMLTVWIAIDPVTQENGPVYYVRGSHTAGVLPTKPSGVRGNSIGLAEPPVVPLAEQFCALLAPGDATIHHCNTIHHSAPNTSDHSRLGFLFVFRGSHTGTDAGLKSNYAVAGAATPPV
ncbi:MAG TPA: phytanoyl-CoA dioxygenase family protein [Verrucomicrobiaceae bacterium]